jgi:hypothetical protein
MARPPRGPNRFREREVRRALRAAQSVGGIARVEIASDGAINLILADQSPAASAPINEWDEATRKLRAKPKPAKSSAPARR